MTRFDIVYSIALGLVTVAVVITIAVTFWRTPAGTWWGSTPAAGLEPTSTSLLEALVVDAQTRADDYLDRWQESQTELDRVRDDVAELSVPQACAQALIHIEADPTVPQPQTLAFQVLFCSLNPTIYLGEPPTDDN